MAEVAVVWGARRFLRWIVAGSEGDVVADSAPFLLDDGGSYERDRAASLRDLGALALLRARANGRLEQLAAVSALPAGGNG